MESAILQVHIEAGGTKKNIPEISFKKITPPQVVHVVNEPSGCNQTTL